MICYYLENDEFLVIYCSLLMDIWSNWTNVSYQAKNDCWVYGLTHDKQESNRHASKLIWYYLGIRRISVYLPDLIQIWTTII